MIVFICPSIMQNDLQKYIKLFLPFNASVNNLSNLAFVNIKVLTSIKLIKQINNDAIEKSIASKYTYKNKNYKSIILNVCYNAINYTPGSVNLLYTKGLKTVLATQNLMTKEHFVRQQDKCVFLHPSHL